MKIIFLCLTGFSLLFAQFNLDIKRSKITLINDKQASVNIRNLKIGQTGVIIHRYKDKQSIIISSAIVESSTNKNSILNLKNISIFNQEAIPTIKVKVKSGDIFILNHLYHKSLLIVPNIESKKLIIKKYKKQTFLSEDFFASYLKLNDNPIPQKEDIQEFCKKQQLGTVFIAIKNNLYIIDVNSFNIIDTININVDTNSTLLPFFSRIKEIEKGFWDFGDDDIGNYDNYYKKLLGLTNDRK